MYLGAALDHDIGDDLSQHTKVVPLIGSTETGPQLGLNPADRKPWYTHDFVPENGHRMVRVEGSGTATDDGDDLYELVIEQAADGEPTWYQSAFWNPGFNSLNKIEAKELYKPIQDLDSRTR